MFDKSCLMRSLFRVGFALSCMFVSVWIVSSFDVKNLRFGRRVSTASSRSNAVNNIHRFNHRPTQNIIKRTRINDADTSFDGDYEQQNFPLKQLQIRFNCEQVESDELSEFLSEIGSLSVSVEVQSEKANYLNDESKWSDLIKTNSWATALLRANFPASFDIDGVIEIINSTYMDEDNISPFQIEIVPVADIDWVAHVQQDWQPQVIDNLVIKFPWHKEPLASEVQARIEHELVLEGGAAFGTGDHPTTRLCCRWLKQVVGESKGDVIDYGCGSGILALAAIKFGAKGRVVGTDIDRDALCNAANNCDNNKLTMKLYIADENSGEDGDTESTSQSIVMNKFRGSLGTEEKYCFPSTSELSGSTFDITVANILAPVLIILAPELCSLTKSGGVIGLSGIVAQQADTVIEVFKQYYDNVQVEAEEDGWVLITGRKP